MRRALALCLLACVPLVAQEIPAPAGLPSSPYFIKKTWMIGGVGNWDCLTMDAKARQLFIAHGSVVQVVDVETGTVAGTISGLQAAHAVALDDTGEYGYISDGPAGQVRVFDRQTFKVVASIPTGPSPRSIVYEPQTKLVFAVSDVPLLSAPASGVQRPPNQKIMSSITVIDAPTRTALGSILLPGRLGFAQVGGAGDVYVSLVDRNAIARFDAQYIASRVQTATANAASQDSGQADAGQSGSEKPALIGITLDWSGNLPSTQPEDVPVHFIPLGPECRNPGSLAVDGSHQQLFVACSDMKMVVLNAETGQLVTPLPTGPGTDAIGFDAGRGLIYSANGGGYGSLTVIRQDSTDTYAVDQNLPTRRRARTLAVDQDTGEVYLVTDQIGVDLSHPGGIGSLKTASMGGSFQVLVIGH